MRLSIPDMSLVVLIGASGSGKSTFARTHFAPTQVLSSDFFRGLVADDETDQSASAAAFDALHYVAGKRLEAGRMTVIDATNVQRSARSALVELARKHHVLPVAIVLDLPESVCLARNAERSDRDFGPGVVRKHRAELRGSLKSLQREGFRRVHVLRSVEEVEAAGIDVVPLLNDKRAETGPFDVIGDVHGCRAELEELLGELGYVVERDAEQRAIGARHPEGRRAVFVGDLVDRGPDTPGVLRLVMGMAAAGTALVVCGNHDDKLARALRGRNVKIAHGLAESLAQLSAEPAEFRKQVEEFCGGLVAHYVLDGGKLVVAHAGLPERYHGRASGTVRGFALYGETTGETDEYGLPVRYPWAEEYRGRAVVLYGHTPTPEAEWINGTMCLDTGCVFGGELTALRYPERELVSVPAQRVWYEPTRPLLPSAEPSAPRRDPGVLDLDDVAGRRSVETRHHGRIAIQPERAAAALEVMSRFAIDPRWLLYLPPTMSPVATSKRPDVLEHPEEAFAGYRAAGVQDVLCEEKHMGSRAVVLVRRDDSAGRFGIEGPGVVHTRTGRPFFAAEQESELLTEVRAAVTSAGLWDELESDWLLLDAELMPWSAKAGALITEQYASVGAAAEAALPPALDALTAATERGVDVSALLAKTSARADNAGAYREAYRRYCWPTEGLRGVRLAPFQLLATEGRTYHDREHGWHLALADRLVQADPELFATTRRFAVDTTDPASTAAGTAWWEELTGAGGEGMVVKPAGNLTRGKRGLVQPGTKVRGREYLRIIYGPDYTERANLDRLRQRGLGRKRGLASREYALGLEGLERLARGEPLWRVHECVFAVLALESEPVDPRL
ncbi:polynucleotide kinase-phosphatase [Saccharopolyspora kobensis]|uniref:Polynucleotide kinase-phosphatase n=2 Tax=Saccharopolyspora kobensis TaxID=146035 RepID=A0A1H6EPL7_9PSEU|nr:polynucleotide kinase-phosphatase [Saccharopolyspora kobensis]SEG98759.1 polynucleotide kinase-phosphatase [Saccharopolyspora kobensis]SFF28975.1 polynucleotide kinase-phosphatase [Saccharopolyspora kobensis]